MQLFYPLILTLIFEGLVFLLFRFKNRDFWILFLLINILTNLSINLILLVSSLFMTYTVQVIFLYILEISAVFIEYIFYAKKEGKSIKLFLCTFLANMLSYSLGLLIFGHI
ncbi:MAG: hypothetical protein BWX97_01394 [Firmicutes bacterium ADurb.Bin146]|nr:MAG: hypothetical protein BWX97_01394 [Firmicutes bacterium ADurb.Bin146]